MMTSTSMVINCCVVANLSMNKVFALTLAGCALMMSNRVPLHQNHQKLQSRLMTNAYYLKKLDHVR